MALLRFSATVGGYTLISRILGYARDILIADILGAGVIADAFFVAFKVPNLLRRLFAEGAFNLAFVPLFAGKLESEGREKAMLFAEQALAMLLYSLLALVAIAEATMPWLMYALAPGFADDPAKFELAITLTRISFPYILFISLVSLLGGVLNSMHRFAAAAAAPILLNICLIAALIGLARATETPGHALAIGVSGAGVIQLVFLYGACRRAGISIRLRLPRLSPAVKRLFVLMAPVAVGAGVAQIGVLIDMIFASHIEGAVSFLYYADRVNQLPLGVIGVAIGTALLPMMTRELRAGGDGQANQNRAMEAALLFALPAAVALMVIAEPLMVVLFERGAFDARASAMSANALIAYAGGLPAFVLIKVLAPAFFAREEPKVPVRIAILCVVVNAGLNGILIWPLGHVGVALATSLSGWLNVALLLGALGRRGYFRPDARLKRRIPRMILAAAVMAGLVWLLIWALGDVFHATLPVRVGALAGLVVSGLFAYAALGRLVGAARLGELRALFRKESGQKESGA
jgi:putative peptidoglycan lipid II flippase